jgi:hypothetical protein
LHRHAFGQFYVLPLDVYRFAKQAVIQSLRLNRDRAGYVIGGARWRTTEMTLVRDRAQMLWLAGIKCNSTN